MTFGRRAVVVLVVSVAGVLAVLLTPEPAETAALPAGFDDRLVASATAPTALAFTPDGRMLITTQTGQVRVYKDGQLLDAPALNLGNDVCPNSERGLLGLAVDPDFEDNGHIYAYYTFNKFNTCPFKQPASKENPVNRVSRFTLQGDRVVEGSQKVLITGIPSPNGNHNAGDLHFGKDGNLYVSVGDGGCSFFRPSRCQPENDIARYRNVLNGKILRVTLDGGIPPDNPYQGAGTRRCNTNGYTGFRYVCQEIFASGLRNPFRMAFDPDAAGTSFRINDVGAATWEEVDAGKRGADYGWNVCEGRHDNDNRPGTTNCSAPPLTPPINEYNHDTGCSSVTDGAYVPDAGGWPASYDRAYLFGDYVCGRIFKLMPNSRGGVTRTAFASGLGQGGPVAMAFGPYKNDQALYYTTYASGDGGQVRRIAYGAANRQPSAVAKTEKNYGEAPLTVEFEGSGSDPDRDPLTYEWDFDYDGNTFEADPDATGPTATHTYTTPGKRVAALRVKDDEGGVSDVATVEVFPGDEHAPDPAIESPAADEHFKVGQEIALQGSATDADEQGGQPDLKWEVIRVHNNSHTHPYASGTEDTLTFDMPAPEDLSATSPSKNYLEVRLTATDSQGLKTTETRKILPKTTMVRFASRPPEMLLRVGGETFRASRSFLSWEGHSINVSAVRFQRKNGDRYKFNSWSGGRAISHTIVTPTNATMYVASFKKR